MKYFCLNIETSTDRRAHCQSEFDREGLEVSFVSAFDAPLNHVRHQEPKYKMGRLGCYLSHHRLIEEIGRYDYSPALVLEDDISLEINFQAKLNETLLTLPEDWELAVIGWWPAYWDYGKITTQEASPHWLRITDGNIWGTYGYMVNGRKGSEKLMKAIQPIVHHIDDIMHFAAVHDSVRGYYLRDPLVHYTTLFPSLTNF